MRAIPILFAAVCLLDNYTTYAQANKALWQTPAYTIYSDKVTQGKYTATANSDTHLHSDYKSGTSQAKDAYISFKFSINGKDNEMPAGRNHLVNVIAANGQAETPLIKFGEQLKQAPPATPRELKDGTLLKIRLDMREVLVAFNTKGYYTTFNGDKIYKADFKGVYLAGNTPPMSWDFDNLVNFPALHVKDEDGDGIYELNIRFDLKQEDKQTLSDWEQSKNTAAFPQYRSAYTLSNAIYNLSLEEMMNAVEPDSTLRTGKEWAGVWTRDVSYSIILSMAYLQPRVAMKSLMRKVNRKKKIIQDTGTGGAWPVSSDRMIWAVAAWEIYKATGDKDWLQQAYEVISNSIQDDYATIYDAATGLVKGESSFLDWRDQTYPKWMQPADIYDSKNLGTNAVHFQANMVAGWMAQLLQQEENSKAYFQKAAVIKNAINKYLWLPGKKYYAQYMYGRFNQIVSPKAEALGEALVIWFGIADATRMKEMVANVPTTAYGISCIYPQIPGIPPYHNNAVWPFVQSYWLWAAKKAGNATAVMESIAAIYRPAALFLTNKENFVADNGDYLGTQINSSNMLWSLAGNISIVHKVLFGIEFEADHLVFKPFVPEQLAGQQTLSNFKYRDAVLDINMQGSGNSIKSFTIDGKPSAPVFAAGLAGKHTIQIILSNEKIPAAVIHKTANHTTPVVPFTQYTGSLLSWDKTAGARSYIIYKNGQAFKRTAATSWRLPVTGFDVYNIAAIDAANTSSFISEPVLVYDPAVMQTIEAEDYATASGKAYQGFSGKGFVELNTTQNTNLALPVDISADGFYFIDCRYSNGNGPVNTENKCAIRTLKDGDKKLGTFVFPQRGSNEWSAWGFSNPLKVYLTKGKHSLHIAFTSTDDNMNLDINQAMLDHIRVIKAGH
jgi:hypothetical protein